MDKNSSRHYEKQNSAELQPKTRRTDEWRGTRRANERLVAMKIRDVLSLEKNPSDTARRSRL